MITVPCRTHIYVEASSSPRTNLLTEVRWLNGERKGGIKRLKKMSRCDFMSEWFRPTFRNLYLLQGQKYTRQFIANHTITTQIEIMQARGSHDVLPRPESNSNLMNTIDKTKAKPSQKRVLKRDCTKKGTKIMYLRDNVRNKKYTKPDHLQKQTFSIWCGTPSCQRQSIHPPTGPPAQRFFV